MKRQPEEWKRIFANRISDVSLVSKVYKDEQPDEKGWHQKYEKLNGRNGQMTWKHFPQGTCTNGQ